VGGGDSPCGSSSGVGIDVIGPTTTRVSIIRNRTHDNVIDGISIDGGIYTTYVNVSGEAVTWSSGPKFNTEWITNEIIKINGVNYNIASVKSTTSMNLTASVTDNLLNVQMYAATTTYDSISRNFAYNNGSGTIGAGFYNSAASGNSYSGNVARLNNEQGFACAQGDFNSYSGDQAYSNDRDSSRVNQGFLVACNNTALLKVITSDHTASPTQVYGVYIGGNSYNTLVESPSLQGAGGGSPLNDLGFCTIYLTSGRAPRLWRFHLRINRDSRPQKYPVSDAQAHGRGSVG
jgi:hypothetical protein